MNNLLVAAIVLWNTRHLELGLVDIRPGFQTPAGLFGDGFAKTIADTTITDL